MGFRRSRWSDQKYRGPSPSAQDDGIGRVEAGLFAAEVGVVAGDPVVAGWSEDVEVVGVFEGLGHVGDVARDDEGLAAVDVVHVLFRAFFADGEAQNAGEDEDDLLVGVRVPGDDAAFLQLDSREHGLIAVDELAREKRVELFRWDVGPGAVLEAFGHTVSVRRKTWSASVLRLRVDAVN
jgi:hypothetical protein